MALTTVTAAEHADRSLISLLLTCPQSVSSAAVMPEQVYSFQGQNFHALRRACLRRGALFKDPLFPASAQSLFYRREPPPGLTWKRPRVSDAGLSICLCTCSDLMTSVSSALTSKRSGMSHFPQIGLIKALSIIGEASASESRALGELAARAADGQFRKQRQRLNSPGVFSPVLRWLQLCASRDVYCGSSQLSSLSALTVKQAEVKDGAHTRKYTCSA